MKEKKWFHVTIADDGSRVVTSPDYDSLEEAIKELGKLTPELSSKIEIAETVYG